MFHLSSTVRQEQCFLNVNFIQSHFVREDGAFSRTSALSSVLMTQWIAREPQTGIRRQELRSVGAHSAQADVQHRGVVLCYGTGS